MKRPLLPVLALCAALAVADAENDKTVVTPASEPGGTPVNAVFNLAGICAVVNTEKGTGKILIVEVLPEGAAEKAGLLAKDQIIKVDDMPVDGMALESVVAMLRGAPGTTVKLSIVRAELPAPTDFSVTREVIRLKEAPSH